MYSCRNVPGWLLGEVYVAMPRYTATTLSQIVGSNHVGHDHVAVTFRPVKWPTESPPGTPGSGTLS